MKSIQETCFNRLNDFKVLCHLFCHGGNTADKSDNVRMLFDAVAVLTQHDIENGHPL